MSRAVRLGLFIAVVATALPIVAFSVALALAPEPTDFMCFWSGAALVARGQDPYDQTTWSAAVDGLFSNWLGVQRRPPCPGSYAYPLWTAIATVPLGILPLRVAALVWLLLLVGGLAAGIVLLARSAGLARPRTILFAAITLGSQPAWLTALTSQYGGIDLAALGLLALPATAARPGRFSLGVILLLLKPHIAPLVVLERARAATGRALVAAGAAALALVVVSLIVRPSWPAEWIDELIGHRTAIAGTSATLYGFTAWLTGQPTIGFVVVGLALAAFVLVLRGADLSDPLDRVAVAVTAGLLAVPYLSSGDPIVLAVAWCAILRRAGTRPLAMIVALVATADLVPWVLYVMREPVAPPGDIRNALELPVTAALLAFALRRPKPEPS
jgi:hypothetical protein